MTDDAGAPPEQRSSTTADSLDAHRAPARVRDVYDEIASHFSKTRAYPWPEVEEFVADVGGGSVGLDIGCGNGRHTELLLEGCETVVGADVSRDLLFEARSDVDAAVSWLQVDAAHLPLGRDTVDVGLYVATLHHLPDRQRRVASLSELARVLTSDGVALVSAWSTAHDRFDVESDDEGFDTTIDWILPGGETIPRFYHIYAPTEFERDLERAGLTVESCVISSGNCYARVVA